MFHKRPVTFYQACCSQHIKNDLHRGFSELVRTLCLNTSPFFVFCKFNIKLSRNTTLVVIYSFHMPTPPARNKLHEVCLIKHRQRNTGAKHKPSFLRTFANNFQVPRKMLQGEAI